MPLEVDGLRCDVEGASVVVPREVGSCRVRARRMPVRRLVGLRPLPAGVLQGDAGAEGTSGSSRERRLRPSLDVPLISHRVELTTMNFRISLGLGGHSYWLHALIENTRFSIRARVLFPTSRILFLTSRNSSYREPGSRAGACARSMASASAPCELARMAGAGVLEIYRLAFHLSDLPA